MIWSNFFLIFFFTKTFISNTISLFECGNDDLSLHIFYLSLLMFFDRISSFMIYFLSSDFLLVLLTFSTCVYFSINFYLLLILCDLQAIFIENFVRQKNSALYNQRKSLCTVTWKLTDWKSCLLMFTKYLEVIWLYGLHYIQWQQ